LNIDDIDHDNCHHINLNIVGNTSTDTLTIAGDTTLHTSADYHDITRWVESTVNITSGFSFNSSTGEITFDIDGIYKGDLWLSVSSDTASTTIGVRYSINGDYFAAGDAPVIKGMAKVAGDILPLSGFGEAPFTSGMVLTVGLAADKACDLTLHEAALVLRRVE